jgi:hypothetical protein
MQVAKAMKRKEKLEKLRELRDQVSNLFSLVKRFTILRPINYINIFAIAIIMVLKQQREEFENN